MLLLLVLYNVRSERELLETLLKLLDLLEDLLAFRRGCRARGGRSGLRKRDGGDRQRRQDFRE